MTIQEDDAIVLDVRTQRESDRSVLLLTGRGERLFAWAPGAARSVRRFGAALQPGARVRARWRRRGESALPVLEEAHLTGAPPRPDPLERYYASAHVLEVVAALAREGQEDPRLYRLTARVLDRLAAGDPPAPLCRYLEAWMLRLAGLLPDLARCDASGEPLAGRAARITPQHGLVADGPGVRGWPLGPAARRWLEATRHAAPDAVDTPDREAAAELEHALPALIEAFTERPLRALRAWRRLERGPAAPDGIPGEPER
ncbi:MAG: hypothetical protein Kow0062_24940 [Acidobacteriota bacterium]|nr:MAG: DNA repair protein RecO [Acidobacteriota bacterium]